MKISILPRSLVAVMLAIFAGITTAQTLPGSLSFTVSGSFENGVGQASESILITDNDLTDGHVAAMDLQDAPVTLNPNGPAGSAAFQWGVAAGSSAYPHTSALWFEPRAGVNVGPDEAFNIGFLYYRNGTIKTTSGASSVDLALNLNFTNPSGMPIMNVSFQSDLINSPNTRDPVASADIVSLRDWAAPLDYSDAAGNRYYFELSFKVDQNTVDGTLSTPEEFRVFEGGQGRADLVGRFTTTPGMSAIPEPSTALLALIGMVALIRRKR